MCRSARSEAARRTAGGQKSTSSEEGQDGGDVTPFYVDFIHGRRSHQRKQNTS